MNNKRAKMKLLVGLLLGAQLFIAANSYADFDIEAKEKSVVLIEVTQNDTASMASGFLYQDTSTVVTALHAMRLNAEITISCGGDRVPARIDKTSARFDLVLLKTTSPLANCKAITEEEIDYDANNYGWRKELVGLGYRPESLEESIDLALSIGRPQMRPLRNMIGEDLSSKLKRVGILDTSTQIMMIKGVVSPGNSGGPVFGLDNQKLMAVVSGGVDNGTSDYNWLMPIDSLKSLMEANTNQLPAGFDKIDELFSATLPQQKNITIGQSQDTNPLNLPNINSGFEWIYQRTRSFQQIAYTADPTLGLSYLWNSSNPYNLSEGDITRYQQKMEFDIYSEPTLGFIIAVPVNTELKYTNIDGGFFLEAGQSSDADVAITYTTERFERDTSHHYFLNEAIDITLRNAECETQVITCTLDETEFYLVDYGKGDKILRIGFYAFNNESLSSEYFMVSYAILDEQLLVVDTRINASHNSSFVACKQGDLGRCDDAFWRSASFVLANAITSFTSEALNSQQPRLDRFLYTCPPQICEQSIGERTDSYFDSGYSQTYAQQSNYYYDEFGNGIYFQYGDGTWAVVINEDLFSASLLEEQVIDGFKYFIVNDTANSFAIPATGGMSYLLVNDTWQEYKNVSIGSSTY